MTTILKNIKFGFYVCKYFFFNLIYDRKREMEMLSNCIIFESLFT